MANTGYKAWKTLEQYNVDTNQATGVTKANVSSDPDYVAPIYDTTTCPIEKTLVISPTSVKVLKQASDVNISVKSNTDWKITNLSSWMSTPLGSTGTGNDTAYVAVAENTFSSSRTGTFNIRTSDDSIILTVTVNQGSGVSVFNHQLAYASTTSQSCGDANTGYTSTYYTDSSNFYNSTVIYNNSSGTFLAPSGYYSDGSGWLYFNGNSVTNSGLCGSGDDVFIAK